MQQRAEVYTNLETIMSSPDNMKEKTLDYYIRNQVQDYYFKRASSGKERFDLALRTYIERWAYKHPQPDDFFNNRKCCR
jgi:hypothetical protein